MDQEIKKKSVRFNQVHSFNEKSVSNVVDDESSDRRAHKTDDDNFILFLDAASDSNFEALKSIYVGISTDAVKTKTLTFYDSDFNTALHFGAKNGNVQICSFIVTEAKRLDVANYLVNF